MSSLLILFIFLRVLSLSFSLSFSISFSLSFSISFFSITVFLVFHLPLMLASLPYKMTSVQISFPILCEYYSSALPINNIETYNFDSPLQRRNEDKRPVDAEGEKFLSLCKNCRIRILNGRTKGDRSWKFTRYPLALREYPSTLDYMVTDTEILHEIESFMVYPTVESQIMNVSRYL